MRRSGQSPFTALPSSTFETSPDRPVSRFRLPDVIADLSHLGHRSDRLLPIDFCVHLCDDGRAMAKDDSSHVQPEFLPKIGRRIVPQLMGVPPWNPRPLACALD